MLVQNPNKAFVLKYRVNITFTFQRKISKQTRPKFHFAWFCTTSDEIQVFYYVITIHLQRAVASVNVTEGVFLGRSLPSTKIEFCKMSNEKITYFFENFT